MWTIKIKYFAIDFVSRKFVSSINLNDAHQFNTREFRTANYCRKTIRDHTTRYNDATNVNISIRRYS